VYNKGQIFHLAGYEFENLIDTSGCNILSIGNLGDFDKLKEALAYICARDSEYAMVGLLQFGYYQRGSLPRFREVFDGFIMLEMTVKGGHGNDDCVLVLLDLHKLRELDLPTGDLDDEEDDA
jgi:hypothetical protein